MKKFLIIFLTCLAFMFIVPFGFVAVASFVAMVIGLLSLKILTVFISAIIGAFALTLVYSILKIIIDIGNVYWQ